MSISTKTGCAPHLETVSAVAKKVNAGTKTASPGPIPSAVRARDNASVPLPHPAQYPRPTYSEISFSKLETSLPNIKTELSNTSPIFKSIFDFNAAYWAAKSINCILFPTFFPIQVLKFRHSKIFYIYPLHWVERYKKCKYRSYSRA